VASHFKRREILTSGLACAAAWPLTRPSIALADAIEGYAYYLHPELREVGLRLMKMYEANPPLSLATLARERQGAALRAPQPLENVPWRLDRVKGDRTRPETKVYVINAKSGGSRPAILYTHGGGFVNGSALSSVAALQRLATRIDCVIVTVEYRLAPETKFGGSLEDNYAALKWLHRNAEGLGVDAARIAVMGESAGGGHAALLAIAARDRDEVALAFQCLIYPMLDDRTGTSRPVPAHVGQIVWNAQRNRFGWESFLGEVPGTSAVPVEGVPARTVDVSRLPPAFIGVGSIDLFCDEDVEYARRLNEAGVSTELIVVPGAFHGFDNPSFNTKVGRWFSDSVEDALRRGLGVGAVPSRSGSAK